MYSYTSFFRSYIFAKLMWKNVKIKRLSVAQTETEPAEVHCREPSAQLGSTSPLSSRGPFGKASQGYGLTRPGHHCYAGPRLSLPNG
jgi:hypothetical protein